jgi:phage/plasmid-like protein (TIGR03299 family)
VLGIVRDSYRPVQNEEITGFADALVASSDAKFETAGVLGRGETVWALAHLPKHVQIAGDPSEIRPYLLVYAGHNGHCALTAKLTMIRVVCNNTLDASIRGAGAQYKVRHTTRYDLRLGEARKALGMAIDYVVAFEEVANDLARREMSTREVLRFTEKLLPTRGDPDEAVLTKRSRDEIAALFAGSRTLEDVAPTAYRLYNAVAEWTDHFRVHRATRKNTAEDNRVLDALGPGGGHQGPRPRPARAEGAGPSPRRATDDLTRRGAEAARLPPRLLVFPKEGRHDDADNNPARAPRRRDDGPAARRAARRTGRPRAWRGVRPCGEHLLVRHVRPDRARDRPDQAT